MRRIFMKTDEIRQKFLDFFAERDHYVRKSYSLIPENDPSILLIGAGMAPLKPYFTGEKTPPHPRMATCQKCVRTPDIEEVGYTTRHATFFEMLGNFSFGDYFKHEAIKWGYEFCIEVLELEPERIWGSVYLDDDEAYDIWTKEVGLPHERMVRLGKEDNFWEIGTGPCGPCSEIYYDRGIEFSCGATDCKPGCDCDRFLELWNLVFTQFNKDEDGNYTTLKQKNIDTGAGLERIAVLMQGVYSIYEIDNVRPILKFVEGVTGLDYGANEDYDVSLRIITEHLRSLTMMVGDGVLPSNEGRGYVLRRILRRASRHARLLGVEDTFMDRGANLIIDVMKEAYPELEERRAFIQKIVEQEEERFQKTIDQGINILSQLIEGLSNKNQKVLDGKEAFKLYDTYGFPLELTREILWERNIKLDEQGFNEALAQQQEQARKALKESAGMISDDSKAVKELKDIHTNFSGYERLTENSLVKGIIDLDKDQVKEKALPGDEVQLFVTPVPFYGESGGQVGDIGEIVSKHGKAQVKNTFMTRFDQTILKVKIEQGEIKTGETVESRVDQVRRQHIMRNHSATHLLHYALKQELGSHVEQAGSMVGPDRLRFDFTHFDALTDEEIRNIEEKIYQHILENHKVEVRNMSVDQAREMGAIALFEEKYDEEVRVVSMGPTRELCGGTHVNHTGEIGVFKIIDQGSVGAGVRRVEALTGLKAYSYFDALEARVKQTTDLLKTDQQNLVPKVESMVNELKEKETMIDRLTNQLISFQVEKLTDKISYINGVPVIKAKVDHYDSETLRELTEKTKQKLKTGIVVIGSDYDSKALFTAMVTKDWTGKGLHAGNIIREVAKITGGGGGGRADMAQAGGKQPEKINEALMEVDNIIKDQLKETQN